jgi:serine/threonine protein kinase
MIDKHPNVVRFYGICDNNIYEMIVLEHCNYGNILSYIARKEFSWEIALSIAHKLAIALEHIHAKNIVVRSLNVYNILVDSEGEPKLSNFLNADFLSDEGSDQAFAEFRSDIMGFGFLMIELGMQRMLHEQERATIKVLQTRLALCCDVTAY